MNIYIYIFIYPTLIEMIETLKSAMGTDGSFRTKQIISCQTQFSIG